MLVAMGVLGEGSSSMVAEVCAARLALRLLVALSTQRLEAYCAALGAVLLLPEGLELALVAEGGLAGPGWCYRHICER